jgi:hypothetical protein
VDVHSEVRSMTSLGPDKRGRRVRGSGLTLTLAGRLRFLRTPSLSCEKELFDQMAEYEGWEEPPADEFPHRHRILRHP